MASPRQIIDPAGRKRRKAMLEQIGGCWPHEIANTSIAGRTRIIAILEQQAATQLKIRNEAPNYYSEDLHILILKALSEERKAIANISKRGRMAVQLNLIKV